MITTEHPTTNERVYTVWRACGETLIVEGREPVWEEPGKQGQLVAEIQAADYEAACAEWNASLSGHDIAAGTERLVGQGRPAP